MLNTEHHRVRVAQMGAMANYRLVLARLAAIEALAQNFDHAGLMAERASLDAAVTQWIASIKGLAAMLILEPQAPLISPGTETPQ